MEQALREREERRRAEQALSHRVDMEQCIASIATKLMVLPPEECDAGIDDALRKIGEFSGIERVCLLLLEESGMTAGAAHEWRACGAVSGIRDGRAMHMDELPWCMERLRRFEVVRVQRAADLPDGAAAERDILALRGVASLLMVPMVFGGTLAGFLGFESLRAEKTWSDEDVKMLGIVSDILMNALERKHSGDKRRMRIEELERFRNATVQREFRIKELKDRVKELENEVNRLKALEFGTIAASS
jgi:GAF domain-containing protein